MDCHGNRPDVTIWACVFHFCLFLIFRLDDLDREEGERDFFLVNWAAIFYFIESILKEN